MRHGFLLVAKPVGPTSHDVVSQVRARLGERKIGHLGTLDPAAEGLLVLAIGAKALKVVELFNHLPKEYRADVLFGSESTTYDREGLITQSKPIAGWTPPDDITLRTIIEQHFLGKIRQVPPAHSAIKVGGERAYHKVRQGLSVDLPSREVEVTSCVIERYRYPELTLRVACGSGTYIRSLAHDLGQVVRSGGYLAGLMRTKVGEWRIEDAMPPDAAAWTQVLPLKEVLASRHRIDLTDEEATDIRFGRGIQKQVQPDTIAWHEGLPIAILIPAKDGTQMSRARKVL